eukprot:CAMPEP_0115298826 /NCGR_PEP_ID=MMETSP0270-20121206/68465_1 /TAXON_ID=71861 /ORGANISM="Scrippsiella trochoidea, Strain CCMP3099" /LENGTH=176 /DNA_ID=CAMNT_0002716529 /DNA_START=85 /DNA_END=612 /DNA_ORIENTATION=+
MLGLIQNVARIDLRSGGEVTQVQSQPVVIRSHRRTDAEMIAEMLKKLPEQAPNHDVAGGVHPSDILSHALAMGVPSAGKYLAGMAQKAITMNSPQPLRCGIQPPPGLRPPPGLEHCRTHTHQVVAHPQHPRHKADLDPVGTRDVYGISKMADEEQCSTNDDGEHDACESLPSEDDV